MRRAIPLIAILTVLVAAVTAASAGPATADPPPEYFVDEAKLPFSEIPGIATDRHWGILNGAGYRIEVPRNWNGRLVMWAHGFRGSGLELTVDNHPLRAFLAANGYAWAASSYSRNEYDVEVGVKDTHALTQQFNGIVGRPQVTYLTGASMGGRVTAAAIEQFPRAYDGALPICGVLGDHELFDVYLDYNLVAARRRPTAASSRPRPGPSPRPARSVVVAARWRLPPCRYSTLPRFRSPSGPG